MIDQLRHFVLVAEHGTFTEAARHAHLSQPALTGSIRRLEEAFDAPLFVRGRTGASLTAAGETLLPRARAAIAAVEEGRRAIMEVQGLSRGEVRLGAGATPCTYLLPPILAGFRARHPGIVLVLYEHTPVEAEDALARGEIDLAIVAAKRGGDPWLDDELVLVASPELRDAERAPFVTFREGASSRTLLDERFGRPPIAMALGSTAAVREHVRAGIGRALISRHAVASDLAAGRLVELADRRTPVKRAFRILHRGVDRLPPASAALRALLLSERDRLARPPRKRAPR